MQLTYIDDAVYDKYTLARECEDVQGSKQRTRTPIWN